MQPEGWCWYGCQGPTPGRWRWHRWCRRQHSFPPVPSHRGGEVCLQLCITPAAVQQEGAAFFQVLHHIVLIHIGRSMASHKVLRLDQIGRTDGGLAEAEMALGQAAGLLGVIDEISLAIEVRRMADDLDGVFVGTHSVRRSPYPATQRWSDRRERCRCRRSQAGRCESHRLRCLW